MLAFQSTRPRGARLRCGHGLHQAAGVSIHAPAWGATEVLHASRRGLRGFNPRARVGRDIILMTVSTGAYMSFNPRARVGRDRPHHNSLRDKDFFQEIREPLLPLDPKGIGQVVATQKTNEINTLLKCEPSRESRTA